MNVPKPWDQLVQYRQQENAARILPARWRTLRLRRACSADPFPHPVRSASARPCGYPSRPCRRSRRGLGCGIAPGSLRLVRRPQRLPPAGISPDSKRCPRHLPNPPKFLAAPPLGEHALSLNTLRHIANTPISKIAHDQNTVCFARPATRCSFLRRHKDATSSWHGPLARADQLEHLHHTLLESDLTVPLCN